MDRKKISKTIENPTPSLMDKIVTKDQTSKNDQAKDPKPNPIINSPSKLKKLPKALYPAKRAVFSICQPSSKCWLSQSKKDSRNPQPFLSKCVNS
jgi:hypothetical protein